jgi:hypothetical protein
MPAVYEQESIFELEDRRMIYKANWSDTSIDDMSYFLNELRSGNDIISFLCGTNMVHRHDVTQVLNKYDIEHSFLGDRVFISGLDSKEMYQTVKQLVMDAVHDAEGQVDVISHHIDARHLDDLEHHSGYMDVNDGLVLSRIKHRS